MLAEAHQRNNEKSQSISRFKQEVMEGRRERLCWWLDLCCGKGVLQLWIPQRAICDVMVLGGKEEVENRAELPHPSGRRGSSYVPRVSCVLVFVSHTSCIIHGLKL